MKRMLYAVGVFSMAVLIAYQTMPDWMRKIYDWIESQRASFPLGGGGGGGF